MTSESLRKNNRFEARSSQNQCLALVGFIHIVYNGISMGMPKSTLGICSEAKFLNEIHTKVLGFFLLAIHSHLYSFAYKISILQIRATSYSFSSSVTVHCIEEKWKLDRKSYPLPHMV
jgi:hypothetical protein